MTKGKVWPSEMSVYHDRFTNVKITQLTDYKAHSHHLYFTENGWYHNQKKVLFISDRNNATNLFSLHIETGEITQLTDFATASYFSVCLHPFEDKAYFRLRNELYEIDLNTLEERLLFTGNPELNGGNINCTADGRFLITSLSEDFSDRILLDLGNGYVGHEELMDARPKSQVIQVDIETGEMNVLFEEDNFITHINTSPTQKHLITFCHEGPWHLVDHRIWGLNIETGEVWKIRERTEERELVGHEYWCEDGETVGYHGFRADGTGFIGKIKYDNTELEEEEFEFVNWHAFSNDFSRVVVDGRDALEKLIVWEKKDGVFSKPKVLCEHRCSFHSQKVHAHPRFTPDQKQILFTSDRNGYGNLYVVDVPDDFSELSDLNEEPTKYTYHLD